MSNELSLEVQYRSLGRSRREWTARFELGDDRSNQLSALRHAHRMNAEIVGSRSA